MAFCWRLLQRLEGCWSLQGKTERTEASGSLDMSNEGPILQFGSTKLYLSPKPISCENSYNQMRYSFEASLCSCGPLLRMHEAVGRLLIYEEAAMSH